MSQNNEKLKTDKIRVNWKKKQKKKKKINKLHIANWITKKMSIKVTIGVTTVHVEINSEMSGTTKIEHRLTRLTDVVFTGTGHSSLSSDFTFLAQFKTSDVIDLKFSPTLL